MLRTFIISVFAIFILPVNSAAQTWIQLPDFPGLERDDGVAFVINNKAYCGTGLRVGWSLGNDFYCLDLASEIWTQVASMPAGQERQYACGFTNGTNGYVFGGESGGNDLNTLWMYSPTTNSWTAKASKPGNGVRGASCFVIGDTAYIVGGASGTINAINEVWAYIFSSDTWIQKNNAPFSIWRASGVNYCNAGAIFFGRDANGSFRREVYFYTPSSDIWSLNGLYPGNGRAYTAAQTTNTTSLYVFVYCGYDTLNNYYNDLYDYYGPNNTFYPFTSTLSFGRKGGMSFANNSSIYYTCGIDQSNTRLKQTWRFDVYVGINEPSNTERMNIYPNPSNETIFIDQILSTEKFKITDPSGRIVAEGFTKGSINVSSLSPGLYFLNLKGFSSKIIIQ